MNENFVSLPVGPNGEYGSVQVGMVNGQLVQTLTLSPAAVLNALAKKLGGPVPAEVALFFESTLGLK